MGLAVEVQIWHRYGAYAPGCFVQAMQHKFPSLTWPQLRLALRENGGFGGWADLAFSKYF